MEWNTVTPGPRSAIPGFGATVERLRARLRGGVLLPDTDAYKVARRVWNGFVDKRPAAILLCTCTQDVVEARRAGRGPLLDGRGRGGGHSIAGASRSVTADGHRSPPA